MKTKLGMALAAAVLASGCAVVDRAENAFRNSPLAGAFAQLDQDGDGVISPQEAQGAPAVSQNFDVLDSNDSGGIDDGEYEAALNHVAEIDFQETDVNGDGVITEQEVGTMALSLREAFDTVDADDDGNVSVAEYEAARTNLLQPLQFQDLDTDGDGVISSDESVDTPELAEHYDRFDTDDDGQLSQDEFRVAQR